MYENTSVFGVIYKGHFRWRDFQPPPVKSQTGGEGMFRAF